MKWSAIFVRGNCYFNLHELKTMWPVLIQFQAREYFQIGKINRYMNDAYFVQEGEVMSGEKVEALLDEAERRGDIYYDHNLLKYEPKK